MPPHTPTIEDVFLDNKPEPSFVVRYSTKFELLEAILFECEFNALFAQYYNKPADDPAALGAIKTLLANRWKRIAFTTACYTNATASKSTWDCKHFSRTLAIQLAKKTVDSSHEYKKDAAIVATAGPSFDTSTQRGILPVNSLLMPTVTSEAYDVHIDQLELHEFILSDSGDAPIHLATVLHGAADHLAHKFETAISHSDPTKRRKLTFREINRLKVHSVPVKEYIAAIPEERDPHQDAHDIQDKIAHAKNQFNESMKQLIKTEPMYGMTDDGYERLKARVLAPESIDYMAKYIDRIKILGHALQCLFTDEEDSPHLKLLKAIGHDKLKTFFKNTNESINDQAGIWNYLSVDDRLALIAELNDNQLSDILDRQPSKKNEFTTAMYCLDSAINEAKLADPAIIILRDELFVAGNDVFCNALPALAELVYRTAFWIKHPEHEGNLKRYPVIANKVKERSWGRIAGGVALLLFGTTLILAAVACAAATAGAALPVSGAIAWFAGKAALTGAIILGLTGIASNVAGSYYLARGKHYAVGQRALLLFSDKTTPKHNNALVVAPDSNLAEIALHEHSKALDAS